MADRMERTLTDADVIAAIRARHLMANVGGYEKRPTWYRLRWNEAHVDPGGTIFGPGPYLKLPVTINEPDAAPDEVVIRVYAPERLRRQLARKWKPAPVVGSAVVGGSVLCGDNQA